ncbi:MAG TPA: hypothetical protein HPP83_00245 [Candidatus Hydrogenedentes bacterium]|nr:hypothetical protein [Candidatus Hydrogenedentota bacterium]
MLDYSFVLPVMVSAVFSSPYGEEVPLGDAALEKGCQQSTVLSEALSYGVASWPRELGNHRAVLHVSEPAEAVKAHIRWRRPDKEPERKQVRVVDLATGGRITNLVVLRATREYGEIVFEPATVPGDYGVYYLIARTEGHANFPRTVYLPPADTADPAWAARFGEATALPEAAVTRLEARTDFDRFDPMEVIATQAETKRLLDTHPDAAYLFFPEDRVRPIRMTEDLPYRWIESGPSNAFHGEARPGEFYVFQIGVYAARTRIANLSLRFADLQSKNGTAIPHLNFECFNLGGMDWLGNRFDKVFAVERGKIRPLWIGVQIPAEARPGAYRAVLDIQPEDLSPSQVALHLDVSDRILEDAGDSDLWRHSRLRWLNSTLGLSDKPTEPYTPIEVRPGNANADTPGTVVCLGREIEFSPNGLPARIRCGDTDVLATPIRLVLDGKEQELLATAGKAQLLTRNDGRVVWQTTTDLADGTLSIRTETQFDGFMDFQIALRADARFEAEDSRLEIPLCSEVATYAMGLGRKGGHRPAEWSWHWGDKGQSAVWIGDVTAGLYCAFRDGVGWANGGQGGIRLRESGDGGVIVEAFTGPLQLGAGEERSFHFALLPTPVKPLDPGHWRQRYFHRHQSIENVLKTGATIINVHHQTTLNPYINYPFRTVAAMKAYADEAHRSGLKFKIYYTQRELSNYVTELWALRSLGDEVFLDGAGGGGPWLVEHLRDGYQPAWHNVLSDGELDAALLTRGDSRWNNYYLEGLAWLFRNVGIDGIYVDGLTYGRDFMQRVRRVLDQNGPGTLLDLHSGNINDGSGAVTALAYMEHFPYIDSLWFGEVFDYDESPAYWLTEVSGIPFGLFGDMLQGGGNPWRGMLFGMTSRCYIEGDPQHVWRFWDEFGIEDAEMIGYWDPACPVRTGHADILATAYRKPGKTLMAVASWADEKTAVRLEIDWAALGLGAERAHLFAPYIPNYQKSALFGPDEAIPIAPGRGWLLVLDEEPHEVTEHAPINWERVDEPLPCRRASGPIVVDGEFDDWDELPFEMVEPMQIRIAPEEWDGPEDLSFRFGVAYDDDYLYIAIETTDDVVTRVPDASPWGQDGLEVRLDARPEAERKGWRGGGEFKETLFIATAPAATSDETEVLERERLPEGVQVVCVQTDTGHNTEIAVPISYLNARQGGDWTSFRLNIAVNDLDEFNTMIPQIWWRPDWRSIENYDGSGTFVKRP